VQKEYPHKLKAEYMILTLHSYRSFINLLHYDYLCHINFTVSLLALSSDINLPMSFSLGHTAGNEVNDTTGPTLFL